MIPQTGKQILTLLACVPDSGSTTVGHVDLVTLVPSKGCHRRNKVQVCIVPVSLKKKKGSSGDLVPGHWLRLRVSPSVWPSV